MHILCDTSSILMLIRIAPEMFTDERFECVTIKEARDEIFQTQKFKTKYPWRIQYKKNIVAIGKTSVETPEFHLYYNTIRKLLESGKINQRTQNFFNLSAVDSKFAACVLAHNFDMTTGDNDLIDFIEQEFSKKNTPPLGIINKWLKGGLITWKTNLQIIIEDWDKCGESAQPSKEIIEFEKLTRMKYNGSR